MSQDKLLPAIEFLEARIDGFLTTLNYLRNHAGMPPLHIAERPDPSEPGRTPD